MTRSVLVALLLLATISGFSQEYVYDGGNLSKDGNKKIRSIHYNYLNLADTIIFEDGRKITYVYTATGHKLSQRVIDAGGIPVKNVDYVSQTLYNNDTLRQIFQGSGRVVQIVRGVPASPWEYQYDQKDHLGNVRTLLTSRQDTENYKATLESACADREQNQFQRYEDARRINSDLFDHTKNGSTSFSQRLDGSGNEKYGLAKSLDVMPGDVVSLKVFAKYADPDMSHWAPMLADLMTQIATGAIGTVVDGTGYSTNESTPFPFAGLSGTSDDSEVGPKAYLNWLVFDHNYTFKTGGYKKIDPNAREKGSNVPHDELSAQLTIKEQGYVYVYLSNEETSPIDVFFDDFTVELVKGPVVQQSDYDPFGLIVTESTREHEANNFLYNGKELQKDLDLNWYDYGARMYDAALGRWHVIDAKTEKYSSWSPYNYVMNNPVKSIDPDGNEIRVITDEPDNLVVQNARKGMDIDLTRSYNVVDKEKNIVVYLVVTHGPVVVRTIGSLVTTDDSGTITGTYRSHRESENPARNLTIEKDKESGRYFIISDEKSDGFESTSSIKLNGIDVTKDVKAGKEIRFIVLSDQFEPNSANLKGVSEALGHLNHALKGIEQYINKKTSKHKPREISPEWQRELEKVGRMRDGKQSGDEKRPGQL
jgi:RHS repeat-associated protein